MFDTPVRRTRVLIVDDQSTGRLMLEQAVLGVDRSIEVRVFASALDALGWAATEQIDLVLADYRMPEIDGVEFIRRLRALPGYTHVPIIMVTIFDHRGLRYSALDAGVTDFLTKPLDLRECMARCRNLLTLRRQQLLLEGRGRDLEYQVETAISEVREREKETLLRLARAGEFRDEETGNHVLRMARYSRLIGEALALSEDDLDTLELAAPLHDIGKIGLPDNVLLKAGRLTPDEIAVMRTHPLIGYEILRDSASKYVRMGALIALGHHEKFDGTGYPYGVKAEQIPLPARIVAVADVFDALTTRRPYKQAWDTEVAFQYLAEHGGTHFDPDMVKGLIANRDKALEIYRELGSDSGERVPMTPAG